MGVGNCHLEQGLWLNASLSVDLEVTPGVWFDHRPTAVINGIKWQREEEEGALEFINRGNVPLFALIQSNPTHWYFLTVPSLNSIGIPTFLLITTTRASMASDGQSDSYDFSHQHNLSRLSLCKTNSLGDDVEKYDSLDEYDGSGIGMLFPSFSFQSLEGDADGELSAGWASEFDEELGYSSLPPTPQHARKRSQSEMMMAMNQKGKGEKEYASENEVHKTTTRRRKRRSSATVRGWVLDEANSWDCSGSNVDNGSRNKKTGESKMGMPPAGSGGESESSGVVVITRPKGGNRSLCMGLEEVKACRDLGFELEHERMLEMSSRVSISASTLDASSGGSSPIAHWCISSPGDDPRNVKARLKVWAQAVALASTSLTH